MNPFDPLLSGALPHSIVAVFAIVILSLLCVYYLFLVIRVSPWRRARNDTGSQKGLGTLKRGRRRVRRRRQR
jgi:hypothetical protein